MTLVQDRDPLAAARRVTIDEASEQRRPAELDQRTADMRDAALLNAIAVAKAHGMSPEWTEADVARWRYMRTMTDAIAAGANEGEALPQGFGPAVRARQTEVLLRIATKATAFVPEQETSR
jgi:hypothetical protein